MKKITPPTFFRKAALATAMAALLAGAAPSAFAQVTDSQITISSASYGGSRNLNVELNKSMIVDLPAGVAEVIVSQPSVAAAIMRTRTRAIIQGITGGDTNIFFLDDAGRTIQVLDLRVIEEPSQVGNALEAALARVIPGSNIKVESVTLGGTTNRVVLTGNVQSGEDRERALQVAIQFAGSPENVASIIDVAGSQQVMLQVTVSEIRRDVARQLGINLSGTATLGSVNLGFNSAQASAGNASLNTGNLNFGDLQINATMRALENRNALRLLAQPTLTAISGEDAEFLVGGEFPVVTVDNDGNRVTTFKQYGVELKFTPTVKSNGSIGLAVETGVSALQSGSSVNLSRRDVKTTVELQPGKTLAIGGLLSEESSRAINQVPGLGNIPILGALFRSNDYKNLQTELVVLVTPYLVSPSPVNSIAVPTDYSDISGDPEAIFLGRLEKNYGVGDREMRGGFSGSVGFVLD